MFEVLRSHFAELAATFLEHYIKSNRNNGASQNKILSMCSTFAELDTQANRLEDMYQNLGPIDERTTLLAWSSSIYRLLCKVNELPDLSSSYSQDIQSAHKIHCLSVEIVTGKIQECADTFKVELERVRSKLEPALNENHDCVDRREDWEVCTNSISMTQQEHVIFSNVPSSTDQSAQCNIRTREATEYRQDLKVAKVKLEKLKIHQLSGKEAISPEKAERIVQGLIRQRIGMIDDRNDELAVLHLEYRLAQIQMDLGRYQNAEATARNVYDKRREFHVAGTSEADLHCSQTQLCESLRRQKTKSKLRQAENMYRMVWNEEDVSERPLRDNHVFWRLENGHNLGIILGEEEKFRPAEDQHREVMAERIEILGCAHVDTAQSAVEVIHNLRKQPDPVDLLSKIHKVVEPIWQSSKKAKELSPLVLWCGAQLGESFYSITKFYEAGTVLRDVWEARKKFCSSDPSDAISTARLLILSLEALGLSQEADTVVDWVGEMTQAQQKAVFTSMPEEFQVNTRSLCRRQKFAEAALVSKEEWKSCSMRQDIDTLDERTLNACYFYGSAVSQIPHTTTQDASSAIAAVQGVYNLLPVTKLSDGSTLKIYYLYAYMLYSMSNNVSGATNVLTNAYTMKRTVKLA